LTHAIVHVELPAADAKAAGKFYHDLFGWKVETDDKFDYVMFQPQDGPGGGMAPLSDDVEPGDTVVYVGTDDIDATLAKAEALGASVVQGEMEIPGMGWLAVFKDPTGNRVGLWKSARSG